MKKVRLFTTAALLLTMFVSNATNDTTVSGSGTKAATAGGATAPAPESASPQQSDARGTARYSYAEVVYQKTYGEVKIFVNGKNTSQAVRTAVSQAKYADEALQVMGDDGWLLATAVTREFNSGFEIFYYFRK